ncbi:hypothetical protein M8J76_013399 [Diaphorina citri]|nr:hypothetical protein M8J76_013399 [Diaphorina citri]
MAGINVSSSWACDNLLACFTIGTNQDPSIMDDIVHQDKCVCLTTTEDITELPCTLDVSADDNSGMAFKTVHIVSQCRLLEVFGHHGEYLNTFHGDLFDEFEDTCIYVTKVKLQSPMTSLSVKFTRLKEAEFWIYGIYLTKINIPTSSTRGLQPGNPQTIGLFPTMSMHSLPSSQPPTLLNFQNFLQTSSNREHLHLPNLLSNFLNGIGANSSNPPHTEHLNDNNSEGTSLNGIPKQESQTSENKPSMVEIECMMDKKLKELEGRIHARFDQLEKKQDLMLNKIEMLLNTLKCTNGSCIDKDPSANLNANGNHIKEEKLSSQNTNGSCVEGILVNENTNGTYEKKLANLNKNGNYDQEESLSNLLEDVKIEKEEASK